ncbi:MAG: DUF2079 domain-containing protein [Chitinophagaceae bacterium]
MSIYKKHRLAFLFALLFFVVYSLLAFVNHYLFKTFALDLGVYTNALYDYGHLQFNDKGVFKPVAENLLSDHFDLYLPLLSPLAYIFGQYTLQLFQILSILAGGLGVYATLIKRFNNQKMALIAQLCLYMSFPVFAALSFDYHSNVPAAMLVPFLFYFAETKRLKAIVIIMVSIWLGKETASLWMVFLSLGMAITYRHESVLKKLFLVLSVCSLVYFIIILKLVMPALANSGTYDHYKFTALGKNYSDAFVFVVTHPLSFLEILFTNHLGKPEWDGVKMEFLLFFALSGGMFLGLRPAFLLMIIPMLVMKLCYDDPAAWSIDTHYSIELAPVLIIGLFFIAGDLNKYRYQLIWSSMLGIVFCTFKYMDNTIYWHDYSRVRLYQKSHYVKNYDVKVVHQQLKLIPEDAIVAAQTPFVPHLAYRDKCYTLPIVKDASYIIASPSEEAMYPIIREELNKLLNDSIESGRWKVQYKDTNVLVLKKN